MKIPIFYFPKTRFKKYLIIEKTFKCADEIIPIGCDCHPAYTLQKLNIRKHSLPFDWLNTDPLRGLEFVTNNLATSFSGFLSGLYKNERGHPVSERYPYAEFMHEKNLIENKLDREKFSRRIIRLEKLRDQACYYLYNITGSSLETENHVIKFYKSVIAFQSLLKENQLLCIYIRHDESLKENKHNCEMLLGLISKLSYVKCSNFYIKNKDKNGIWGNKNKYPMLYKSLGIKISLGLPRIKFH